MRVAYLVNQYPKVSHSFIRREILALERQGCEVIRFAIRGWDLELVDPSDLTERTNTEYVLEQGILPLLVSLLGTAISRPIRLVNCLLLAWRMSRNSDRRALLHLAYVAEASRIVSRMQEKGIQHLHAHFGTNSAEVAMLTHELGGPPWSFTVHGPEEFDRKLVIGLAEKVRRCAFVVAISSFGRAQIYRLVEKQLWSKVHVVHCGLDTGFAIAPQKIEELSRRLVCVGRLCEQKGQILLLEAARRLCAKGIDFELVLAGDGDMRQTLEALIHHHNLGSIVRITGWISGKQVREEIERSRALVLPSFAEGLPVAIMEAMALERSIISTFVAGIPELVRDKRDGWLVPAGDVDALVDAMEECLQATHQSILAMGSEARARVLERHNVETEAQKLLQLFRASINAKRFTASNSMTPE